MSINLSFDGSTEARGRNGWFQLREAQIYTSQETPWVEPPYTSASVWLYSKNYGKFAPIYLKFHHAEELRTLICGLSKLYAQMLTTPEEEIDHA